MPSARHVELVSREEVLWRLAEAKTRVMRLALFGTGREAFGLHDPPRAERENGSPVMRETASAVWR